MCGIAGFTHIGHKGSSIPLRRALQALHHRGPDQQGVFESLNASVGAVRLQVIDLHGGDQPMRTADGDLTLVFNGEIFNHRQLRAELESLGHRFETNCDTEVVLRAFDEWDTECFSKLRGMFAAAFWRESERRLLLVRDRLGIKPLYYTYLHSNIYFGSELKAILEFPEVPRMISPAALSHFLSLNYVPAPLTMVDGIEKVAPGSWLEFRKGHVRTEFYWRNRFAPDARISSEDAQDELDSLLREATREQLAADVPTGLWLSGGLDSSSILHYAAEASSRPIQTFSITFSGHAFDERRYCRQLASVYGTDHHEFDVTSDLDLAGAIHDMAYHSDEPGADAGALPVWFLAKATRRSATVALSGEGADEIFGGYQTYVADGYAHRARTLPAPLLKTALRCAEMLPVSDRKIGFEYKLKRFLAGALMAADDAHFFWNGSFSAREKAGFGLPEDNGTLDSLSQALPGIPANGDVLARYLYTDQHYYLPDNILYKTDRMSMAHAVEVRPPFLDHRIVEFAGRLPTHLKISGRRTKRSLRALMRHKLPPSILGRRKEGFDIPAHAWLRGPLRPLLLETLSEDAVRAAGIFAPQAIRDLVDRHLSRQANLGYHLWGLMMLHMWARRWSMERFELTGDSRWPTVLSAAG